VAVPLVVPFISTVTPGRPSPAEEVTRPESWVWAQAAVVAPSSRKIKKAYLRGLEIVLATITKAGWYWSLPGKGIFIKVMLMGWIKCKDRKQPGSGAVTVLPLPEILEAWTVTFPVTF
jgi:hypothetical protein